MTVEPCYTHATIMLVWHTLSPVHAIPCLACLHTTSAAQENAAQIDAAVPGLQLEGILAYLHTTGEFFGYI